MLQFIMEHNLLLYLLAASALAGAVSQLILRHIYTGLINDTKHPGESEGRFLQQLRQRFQYCRHLNEKVGDVRALIQKSIMEYSFWGMSLHRWKRFGGHCLAISTICALIGTYWNLQSGGMISLGNLYVRMGLLSAVVIGAAYGGSDTGYLKKRLEVRLTDYLENSGAVREYSEEDILENESITSILDMESGRKVKKRGKREAAAARTRAQKEKLELKENLARMKAGMQETAAEREKERNIDLLRQMDPHEQERILRDVLREVLT